METTKRNAWGTFNFLVNSYLFKKKTFKYFINMLTIIPQ